MNEIIMDNRIYNYIVHNSDINKDENKVIEFGIEMIKMLSVAAIVAILIAMIMKMLPEAVFFLFTFIPLRQNAGGYHTRHRITCAIMSVFIYIFVLIIIKNFEFNALMQIFLCFIDSLIILCFAPVENENKKIDKSDRLKFKIISISITFIEIILSMFIYYETGFDSVLAVLPTIIVVDVAILVEIILKERRKSYVSKEKC